MPLLYRPDGDERKPYRIAKIADGRVAARAYFPRADYFPLGAVLRRRRPMSTSLHLPMGGDQSSHSAKRKPNENSCLAEARTLGGGFWRHRHGYRRLLTTRVEDGRDRRAARAGTRRYGGRRGARAVLCGEGPAGNRAGGAGQVPGRAVIVLAQRSGGEGRLGDARCSQGPRQLTGAGLLGEALCVEVRLTMGWPEFGSGCKRRVAASGGSDCTESSRRREMRCPQATRKPSITWMPPAAK
jgi:hypothetical protein